MKKYLPLLLLSALAASAAIGQTISQIDLSGNECWNAGQGPGGPSTGFLCVNTVRSSAPIQLVSGSGSATTALSGPVGTVFWVGTAPTTWGVTLPSPAIDGQIVTIATDTTLTTMVTVTAGTGQTLNASYTSQTLTAVTNVAFQYARSTAKWYRLQ
jgi:hypothetical protein